MAAENELDQAFITLLDQNILGAQAAGNEEASKFLVKIRDACMKWRALV
jgi:hypothetical protein